MIQKEVKMYYDGELECVARVNIGWNENEFDAILKAAKLYGDERFDEYVCGRLRVTAHQLFDILSVGGDE